MEIKNIRNLPPGCVGALIDDVPLLTAAHVRPYVVASLLHRGAVRHTEIIASLIPHCSNADLIVGGWDPFDEDYCENTRAEKLVDEVLAEFLIEGLVRYNDEKELWVLTSSNLSRVISWAAALGAKLPGHLLSDMSKAQKKSLPSNLELE
jgi:hypothetical protein